MRTVIKAIGIAIVAAGGIGLVARAETTGQGFGPPFMHGHMGPGMTEMRDGPHGFTRGNPSTRLAALKTDLGITPAQEAAWDTYAKVVQDTAAQFKAANPAIDQDAIHAMSPQDREAFMAKMHDQRGQAFATVKAAAQALLPSLDEAQKAKAQGELPGLAAHGPHMMRHAGMGMDGGMGRMGGMGMMGGMGQPGGPMAPSAR